MENIIYEVGGDGDEMVKRRARCGKMEMEGKGCEAVQCAETTKKEGKGRKKERLLLRSGVEH